MRLLIQARILLIILCFGFLSNHPSFSQQLDWLWAKGVAGLNNDGVSSIVFDPSGNIYMSGSFESPSLIFGADTLFNTGYHCMFLVKQDGDGNVLWGKVPDVGRYNDAISVALDPSGNPFIAGYFADDTLSLGSYTLLNMGIGNTFIAKYDTNGNVKWAKCASGGTFHQPEGIAVDASGSCYMAGWFQGPTVTFDSITLTNTVYGKNDIFLVKYDSDGNVIWAKSAGGIDWDYPETVFTDASGCVYLEGSFESPSIAFGSDTLTNSTFRSMFITKYDSGGNVLWAKNYGKPTAEIGVISAAVDNSGNIYLTGVFYGSLLSFGSDTLTNAGESDILLAKVDSSGSEIWAKSAGGTDSEYGISVATDDAGNEWISGCYSSPSCVFGTDTLTCAGWSDLFLAKYSSNGEFLSVTNVGGPNDECGSAVAMDESGNLVLAGSFASPSITFGPYTLNNTGIYPSFDIFLTKSTVSTTASGRLDKKSPISIFPNPANNEVTLAISKFQLPCHLIIFDINGQELKECQITKRTTQIDINTFPKGIYFVQMTSERDAAVGKFVKQ
jgi:hypothetical protein